MGHREMCIRDRFPGDRPGPLRFSRVYHLGAGSCPAGGASGDVYKRQMENLGLRQMVIHDGTLILDLSRYEEWSPEEKAFIEGLGQRFRQNPESIPSQVVLTSSHPSTKDEDLLNRVPALNVLRGKSNVLSLAVGSHDNLKSDRSDLSVPPMSLQRLLDELGHRNAGKTIPTPQVIGHSKDTLDADADYVLVVYLKDLAESLRRSFERLRLAATMA